MVQLVDRFRGLVGTLGIKAPVRVATTANITLSGTQVIDGITPADGDRILVRVQTNGVENGIYDYASSGPWSRSADMDGVRDLVRGTQVLVTEGTNANVVFVLTTSNPEIGVSTLVFSTLYATATATAQTLTPGDVWNPAAGNITTMTLTSNITMPAPVLIPGSYWMVIVQGGVGGYTISWNALFDWPFAVAPVLSTTVGSIDIISFFSNGQKMFGVAQLGFG